MREFTRRRHRLERMVREAGVDLLAVSNPVNVSYLTNFSGDSSWLLIGPKRALLVSDGRYTIQIQEECSELDVHIRRTEQTIVQAVAEVLIKLGVHSVGVEASHLTLAEFEALRENAPAVSWSAMKKLVEKLRMIKDASELVQIREAIQYAEKAHAMFRAMLTPADSEKELGDAMDGYLRRAGAMGSSFPTIVGVGDNSAKPHAPLSQRRADESPFLLLDWGASGRFYKSDITRMIWHGEKASVGASARRAPRATVEDRLKKLYTIVLEAQTRALKQLRPGVTASTVDEAVRSYLEREGYNKYFNHGLGHGIGLQIHEGPNIRAKSPDVLEAGMVFTLEPGVYLPDFAGVRIEDDILLTPDCPEVLTHVPKSVDEVFSTSEFGFPISDSRQ